MPLNLKQTTTPRSLVALKLPLPVPALVNHAQAMVKALTGNLHFPTTIPSLVAIGSAIAALNDAENVALTRVKGAVVQRNAAKKVLVQQLQLLKANVQNTADGDPDNALAIIESAGMSIRSSAVRKPRVFTAVPAGTSGNVTLIVPSAGPRSSYEWESSIDGGKTWVAAPPCTQAKTTISGMPAGTSVLFRYRAVTPKAGATDWSPAVSLLVQ